MTETHRHFIPAAGRDWLLPLYDSFTRLLGMDSALRRLVEQAALAPGQRVLDLGCGTGALTLLTKRTQPDIEIVGLDPDAKALARARRKAKDAGLDLRLEQGFGDALPFPDESFDRVLSSFMFHHLEVAQKPAVLREVHRVLRPGGELHLLDFGGGGHGLGTLLAHLVHRDESLRANTEHQLTLRMREAGFGQAEEIERRSSLVGGLVYYGATRSAA